jgi:hypothetical protein
MAQSQKVTVAVNASGQTVSTTVDANAGDILLTALSADSAVTGMLGLTQRAGLFIAGMATQNVRMGRGINPFSA